MFADLWDGLLEVAGDVGNTVVNAVVEVEKEKARQPETLKQAEPIKGKRVDGSTVVAQPTPQAPASWMTPQNMMIGGGILIAFVGLLAFTRR